MESLYIFITLGFIVMGIVIVAFIITIKTGQYDDMEGPAYRILMDDDDPRIPGNEKKQAKRSEPENP